jgi:hypothetical protein
MEIFTKSIQHLVEINSLSRNMWKKMEEWKIGRMEHSSIEVSPKLQFHTITPILHSSILPSFHPSILPSFPLHVRLCFLERCPSGELAFCRELQSCSHGAEKSSHLRDIGHHLTVVHRSFKLP